MKDKKDIKQFKRARPISIQSIMLLVFDKCIGNKI